MQARTFGAGPPLVLVPGWGMTSDVWVELAETLAVEWRVSLVDLPGHGFNRGVAFDPAKAAGHLAESAPPGALWMAWSLGAQVALKAALDGADLEGLVLLAATPRFVTGAGWPHAMAPEALADLRARVRRNPRRGLSRFLGLLARGGPGDAEAAHALRDRLAGAAYDDDALLAGLDWLAEVDLRPELDRLPVPSCWLAGERDPIVPPAASEAGARLAGGQTALVPDGGHIPFLSHPRSVLSALSRARTICGL